MNPDGLPTLVSPWYPNGKLLDYLRSHTQPDRPSLALDVSNALEYLHLIPVVHGDIKAVCYVCYVCFSTQIINNLAHKENVLVNSAGSASLCDFGMSQFLDEAFHITGYTTTTGNAGGTVRYQSRELLDDGPKTTMSDMWAFACLITVMLTDQLPYSSVVNRYSLPIAIAHGGPPNTNPDGVIEESLWNCLTRCWSMVPAARPRISELAPHLSLLVDFRYHKKLALSQILPIPREQVLPANFSPDGSYLAVVAVAVAGLHQASVRLWRVENGACSFYKVISVTCFFSLSLVWSPIGDHFMLIRGDKRVDILNVKTNRMTGHFRTNTRLDSVAWLPSGTKIARAGHKALCIINMQGNVTATHSLALTHVDRMAFISETTSVFVEGHVDESKEARMIVKTMQVEREIMLPYHSCRITLSKDGQYALLTSPKNLELWKIPSDEHDNEGLILVCGYKQPEGYPSGEAAYFGDLSDQLVIYKSSADGIIHIWDRNSATLLRSIQSSKSDGIPFMGVSWNDANVETPMFASWSTGSTVQIWSTLTSLSNQSDATFDSI